MSTSRTVTVTSTSRAVTVTSTGTSASLTVIMMVWAIPSESGGIAGARP